MEKLHDFNSFSESRRAAETARLEEEKEAKRNTSAEGFKTLLSEYGVTSITELSEEEKASFFDKLRESVTTEVETELVSRLEEAYTTEGNAFGAARAEAIKNGDKEFTVDGETYPVEDVDADDKENAEEFAGESEEVTEETTEEVTEETTEEVTEAEVKTEEDFREYATTVLKKAFGDEYDEAKATEVIDGILAKCDGDHSKCVGMLQSSLG